MWTCQWPDRRQARQLSLLTAGQKRAYIDIDSALGWHMNGTMAMDTFCGQEAQSLLCCIPGIHSQSGSHHLFA